MKKRKQLSELTLEELTLRKNTVQAAAIGLGIVMLAAIAIVIYLVYTTGKPVLLVAVMGCLLPTLAIVIGLKQLNQEIKTRNEK